MSNQSWDSVEKRLRRLKQVYGRPKVEGLDWGWYLDFDEVGIYILTSYGQGGGVTVTVVDVAVDQDSKGTLFDASFVAEQANLPKLLVEEMAEVKIVECHKCGRQVTKGINCPNCGVLLA